MFRIAILLVILSSQISTASEIDKCIKLQDATERLSCYDQFHGYSSEETELQEGDFDEESLKRSTFSILPHRMNYFMPVSYNENRQFISSVLSDGSPITLDKLESKFQISFKFSLWDEILGENSQLMAGYTQKSFWQIYNSDLSSPFRETNYEPELFLSKKSYIDVLGLKLVNTNLGFVHQSNGGSINRSRSWNRIYANFIFVKDDFVFSVKPWVRLSEDAEDDDNPDIDDYLGSYELGMLYKWGDSEFTLMLRNLGKSDYQETYQLGWLYPINDNINFYAEYFHGYGESLINYNTLSKTFSLGFSITNWID